MAHYLFRDVAVESLYADRKFKGGRDGWRDSIRKSNTLYIGNLSFYTTEEQLYEIFQKCGPVHKIIMGLDRFSKTPCGFCFVEYKSRQDTEDAMKYINGLKLDERVVRVDWDAGFVEGRQYGRGRSGGQVRDEYRTDFDAGRGGWGKAVAGTPFPTDTSASKRTSHGGDSTPASMSIEEGPVKRTRTGEEDTTNPRFREQRDEDEED